MSRFTRLAFTILMLALFATACGGGSETAVEVPAATSTPAPEPTSTPEPEPTATAEPEPTAIPEPEEAELEAVEPNDAEPGDDADEVIEDAGDGTENADPLDPELVAIAETVWTESCAGCHGANGEGASRGRPLDGIALENPVEQHIGSVENGIGRMPGFATKLTPEEIDAVVAWVRATF